MYVTNPAGLEQKVRKYEFAYDWTEQAIGGENETHWEQLLGSVTEFGSTDGTNWAGPLPSATFTYTPFNIHRAQDVAPDWYCSWDATNYNRNRLTQIRNGYGGSVTYEYTMQDGGLCSDAKHFRWWGEMGDIRVQRYAATARTLADGLDSSSTGRWTYQYSGGKFDDDNFDGTAGREFRGYAEVRTTDPASNLTISRFYQDDTFKGKLREEERYEGSAKLLTKTVNGWGWRGDSRWPFVYLGDTTIYDYDSNGANPQSKKTRYDYDAYGNVQWVYYDANGNLTSQTDAKNQTITFTYDSLNRLTSKSSGESYSYDAYDGVNQFGRGRRTGMSDASGSTYYAYDKRGRLTAQVKVVDDTAYRTSYTYDAMDRVVSTTYPDGEVVTNTYNAQTLLNAVNTSLGGSYVSGTSYNALGQIATMSFGNNTSTTYDYYPNNSRLRSLVTNNSLQNLGYVYDGVGNVTSITESGQTTNFDYDDLDRLVSVSGGYSASYGYDSIGRLLNMNGQSYVYQSGKAHAPSSVGGHPYYYDGNGNLSSGNDQEIIWDDQNRPVRIRKYEQRIMNTDFVYDGDGQRTKVTKPGPTNVFTESFANTNGNWWYSTHQTVPYLDNGLTTVKSAGTGADWSSEFYRAAYAIKRDKEVSLEFKVDGTDTSAHFFLENDDTTYRRWGVIAGGGTIYVQYVDDNGWYQPQTLISPIQLNTWYVVTLRVEYTPDLEYFGFEIEVHERDNPAVSGSYTHPMATGRSWRFHHIIFQGTAYIANYVERGRTVTTSSDSFQSKNSYWVFSPYQAVPFLDNGQYTVKSTGTGADWGANFHRAAYTLNHGKEVELEFQVDITNTSDQFFIENDNSGTYRRLGVIADQGKIYVQYNDGAGWNYPGDLINPVKLNTWYVLTIKVDDISMGFQIGVRERDNPQVGAGYGLGMPRGLSWRFYHQIWRGTAYIANYAESRESNPVIYVGNLYEKEVDSGQVTKYYYANGKRIAMRKNGILYYILSDHLGSSSVIVNANGVEVGRTSYYPYGGTRAETGSLPTDRLFTGKQLDSSTNLYYYGARYYDPSLGLFVSADAVVPNPMNPQALNRYSYGYNNPLKYIDPSGHDPGDAWDFLTGVGSQWGYNNAWMLPQAREALAVKEDESLPMTVGRHVGNAATVLQGVGEIVGGTGGDIGGALACATGAGCVVGAPALAAGTVVAVHGAATIISGVVGEAQLVGDLLTHAFSGKGGARPSYVTVEDAKRETAKWKVDKNLANSDDSHLEAVFKERKGGQLSKTPGGHVKEVGNARAGLNNALETLSNALRDRSWNEEARQYLFEQQAAIEERIRLIDQALYGPLD